MLTARQNEIIQRLDQLNAQSTPLKLNTDPADLMGEYANSDELLTDLVERYAASPSTHLVTNLAFCIHRRMFTIDPTIGTSLALRIIHLHTCKLDPGTASMIARLLDLSKVERLTEGINQTLADLRTIALLHLDWCPGSNPPIHFWPTLDLLDNICESGLQDRILTMDDQLYAVDQLSVAFERNGSSLDKDDREKYRRILSAFGIQVQEF